MFLFASFLYLIFNNFFSIKEKIIKIFLLSLVVIGLFNFNPQLKEHFIKRTFEQIGITKTNQKMHESFGIVSGELTTLLQLKYSKITHF